MKKPFNFSRLLALILPLTFAVFATGCGDDDDDKKPTPNPTDQASAQLRVNFEHHVKGEPLELNTKEYTNAAGNKYNVTTLKYYIGNVTLLNSANGDTFQEKDSYHLINVAENKLSFTVKDIPAKAYDQISFAIGVDSAANLSTDHRGDLNTNNDMAWDWNTGYIFMKFEGMNLKANPTDNHGILLHIGNNVNYKKVTFPIGQNITFAADKVFNANLRVDVNALLKNPNTIDFNTTFNVMMGPNAAKVADNYADGMFSLQEVKQQ